MNATQADRIVDAVGALLTHGAGASANFTETHAVMSDLVTVEIRVTATVRRNMLDRLAGLAQ